MEPLYEKVVCRPLRSIEAVSYPARVERVLRPVRQGAGPAAAAGAGILGQGGEIAGRAGVVPPPLPKLPANQRLAPPPPSLRITPPLAEVICSSPATDQPAPSVSVDWSSTVAVPV